MRSKDEVFEFCKCYKVEVENQKEKKIKILHSDIDLGRSPNLMWTILATKNWDGQSLRARSITSESQIIG